MTDPRRERAEAEQPLPGPEADAAATRATDAAEDTQGHSATIYRRRRGPYPLRHGAPLPDAEDRTRTERHPPGGRAVA